MINRLVAPEMLMREAHNLAKRLIAKNPRAVAGSKPSVNAIAATAAREISTVQPVFPVPGASLLGTTCEALSPPSLWPAATPGKKARQQVSADR
jgi:hypothetical protein